MSGGRLGPRVAPYVGKGVWSLAEASDRLRYAPQGVDPDWSRVALLLHFNGADTSTTFIDAVGHTVTASGGAVISTAQSKFEGSSGYFPTSGSSKLTIADAADLRAGAADLTLDGWFIPVAPTSGFGGFLIKGENTSDGIAFGVTPTSVTFRSNGTTDLTASVTISTTAFTHVRFVRQGTAKRIYVGGTKVAEDANGVFNASSTASLLVGAVTSNANYSYRGYIDELRLVHLAPASSADFTPPSQQFYG